MCGKGSQSTNSSSTYTPNAQAGSAYSSLLGAAQNTAQTPYNPATATTIAGLTPQQQQAFGEIGGLQGAYQPTMNQAGSLIQQSGAPISSSAISSYENPYQADVINSTMAQMGQMDAQQQQGVLGNAASQGALGGSRTGVTQAALAGQQQLSNASTLAGLNSSNYSQALSAAQADRTAAGNAGNSMANLGAMNQNLGLESASALYGAGSAQQQQQQNVNNAASSNAQSQTMWPYQNEQWLAGLLGGLGPLMGGTTNGSSTTTQNPGLGGILGGLMMGASGLKDGGAARRANGGGFDFSNFVPLSSLQPAHVNEPALISAPAAKSSQPSMADWSKMGKGLGNIDKGLFGTSTSPTSSNGGWETSTQTDGLLGSGGLGSMLGFADGGDTSDPFANASTLPNASTDLVLPQETEAWSKGTPGRDAWDWVGQNVLDPIGQHLGASPTVRNLISRELFGPSSNPAPAANQPAQPTGIGGMTQSLAHPDLLQSGTPPAPAGLGATQPVTSTPPGGLGSSPPPALPDEATPVKSETYPGISQPGAQAPAAQEEPATGISDNGVDFIKNQESFSAKPYSDYHQTSIGYGTKAQPGETSIDRDTAEARLRDETSKIGAFIQSNAKVPLTQNQYDALTSFGYNTGTGPLGKVIADINAGKTDDALARMQRYTKAGGETSDDLIKRRAAEVAMFGGDNGAEPGARITPAMHQASEARVAAADNKSSVPADQQGGLLYKLFGVNPLGLTSKDRQILFATGAGTLAGGPFTAQAIGRGGLQGLQTSQALDQRDINARQEAQKMAIELEKMRFEQSKPTLLGESTDALGANKKVYGTYDPSTRGFNPVQAPGLQSAASAPQIGTNPNSGKGAAYFDALPPEQKPIANAARAIWNYDQPPLTGRNAATPYGARVMNAVEEAGGYDATKYPTKQAARTDWTAKKTADTLTNGNTGIGHLYELGTSMDAIGNTSYPAYNSVRNAIREQLGDPRADVFDANAGLAAEELTSFYRGAGGNEADIKRLLDTFNASKSQQQQRQVLGRIAGMVEDKVDALKQKRDFAFGEEKGAQQYPILTPKAEQQIAEIKQWAANPNARLGQTQQAAPPVSDGARPVGMSNIQLKQRAQAAIAAGKDPAAVNARLQAWGIQ